MPIDLRTIGRLAKTAIPGANTAGATVKHLEHSSSVRAAADAVRLTDVGAILQHAEQLVAGLPVVDTSRVSAISTSLNQGEYIVDAGRVAEKIIELEYQLPE